MPARVLGAKMCTVIGAEPGLMQWITHTLPVVQTRTHAGIHTRAQKGAERQRQREACRDDLGFSRLSSATALLRKGVVQISHAGTHTNTPTPLIIISLSCRERKRKGGSKWETNVHHRDRKGEDLPPTQSPSPSLHPLLASLFPSSPSLIFPCLLLYLLSVFPSMLMQLSAPFSSIIPTCLSCPLSSFYQGGK